MIGDPIPRVLTYCSIRGSKRICCFVGILELSIIDSVKPEQRWMSTTHGVSSNLDHNFGRDLFVALTQKGAPFVRLRDVLGWGWEGGRIEQARCLAGRDIRFARVPSFIPGRRYR